MKKPIYKRVWFWVLFLPIWLFFTSAIIVGMYEGITGNDITPTESSIMVEPTDTKETAPEETTISVCQHNWTLTTKDAASNDKAETLYYICSICNESKVGEGKKLSPITILDYGFTLDSANGAEGQFKFRVNSNKEIKYVNIYFGYLNRVKDPLYCEIRWKQKVGVQFVGPYNCGDIEDSYTADKFYNPACYYITIYNIQVEYMDGEIVYITEDEYVNIFQD